MTDRFQAMQLFVRIVALGSFTRAAAELDMPRATATLVIKQLEARLGVRLLLRTTRHVSATEEGQAYLRRCVAILAELERAEQAFSEAARKPQGRLKIDLSGTLWRHVLAPMLPEFCERHPRIQVEMSAHDQRIDLVKSGVDCVLRIGDLGDTNLVARQLTNLPQITCVSAAYAARHGSPASLADLPSHRMVNYVSASSGKVMPMDFLVDGRLERVALPATVSVRNGDAYVAAGEAGFGLIQVPRYHVQRQLEAGTLLEVLPQHRPPALPLSVLYPSQRHLPLRVRVFVDWLVGRWTDAPVGVQLR
jgi:LysR family transcriptional regulator for bpeEF and oprC